MCTVLFLKTWERDRMFCQSSVMLRDVLFLCDVVGRGKCFERVLERSGCCDFSNAIRNVS